MRSRLENPRADYWIAIAATSQTLDRGSSVTKNSLAANQRLLARRRKSLSSMPLVRKLCNRIGVSSVVCTSGLSHGPRTGQTRAEEGAEVANAASAVTLNTIMSSEREDHHREVAATENSLLANDNSHSVCGTLASAEAARGNVPTLTRSEADGRHESTQQSRRSPDDEGFRCRPAFSKERCYG